MKLVGEQLEKWAFSRSVVLEKNLFGRSAFNRYYYSAFLTTREMLGDLKPSWRTTRHNEIPNLLETTVRANAIKELKKQKMVGIMSHSEASTLQSSINRATSDLANLLRQAYSVRVTADYKPEVPVVINGKVMTLDGEKLSTANTWPDKANGFCKVVRKVWGGVGLV